MSVVHLVKWSVIETAETSDSIVPDSYIDDALIVRSLARQLKEAACHIRFLHIPSALELTND